jgi:hypothetical protein
MDYDLFGSLRANPLVWYVVSAMFVDDTDLGAFGCPKMSMSLPRGVDEAVGQSDAKPEN